MYPEMIEFSNIIPVKAFVMEVESYPYHWHDALEIIQVLKGSIQITLGNDELLLRENDIAVINMNELHSMAGNQQENEVLCIHVQASFYQRVLQDDRYLFLYCCSVYHEAVVPEKYWRLKEYLIRLVAALEGKSCSRQGRQVEDCLSVLLAYLTDQFDFLRWGFGTVPFNEKRVARLRQMAGRSSCPDELNLSLRELAREAGVSLQHLSNDIKEKFGMTFQELVYYSKCEHAAKLLLSTGNRIIDIALECGFSDPKYLIKHFRQNFRYTPSQFRKRYRSGGDKPVSRVHCREYPLSQVVQSLISQQ